MATTLPVCVCCVEMALLENENRDRERTNWKTEHRLKTMPRLVSMKLIENVMLDELLAQG